ncbi:hypothetical protein [Christiangramia forsetii]|uniref:MotA/TolQ/ExbB proton channel domain-containing protein n=2 Tax=Christiangramia forsetii TaxID=411153 RepID=A0M3D1_CHRFK|nr:hypothetical protein [Christiangramia forsetii]GGG26140.1 hypothetical protein GCM10011532_06950 [Christiangramia forsetii]CAL67126.1 conserved hypothetical protein, membrane [Christiangramia forsetii KT0803]
MISLFLFLFQGQGFFGQLTSRIQEGGSFQMTLILILFLLIIFLIVRSVMKLKAPSNVFKKSVSLVNQAALLAVVIGLFSQLIGLIGVFDAFESLGNINPSLFAGGLKLTLLPPVFGGFTFIIGRTATFILNWLRDEELDKVAIRA